VESRKARLSGPGRNPFSREKKGGGAYPIGVTARTPGSGFPPKKKKHFRSPGEGKGGGGVGGEESTHFGEETQGKKKGKNGELNKPPPDERP